MFFNVLSLWPEPGMWEAAIQLLELKVAFKLVVALVLGAAIGFEREQAGKPAGLRTNLLICVGAALLTDISLAAVNFASGTADGSMADPGRIAAQIVSGIGFIGAGTILVNRGNVLGLTTAATLWVVAAIGMAVGMGNYVAAIGTTILVLVALTLLGRLEARFLEHTHFLIEITTTDDNEPRHVKQWLRQQDIPIRRSRLNRQRGRMQADIEVEVQAPRADQLQQQLSKRPQIDTVEVWGVTK